MFAVALVFGPGRVAAAPGTDAETRPWAKGVSAESQTRALGLFKAGNAFLAEGRLAPALAEYQKAVKQWDHPTIRYNMVICLVRLGRPLKAYRSLKRALRFGKAPLEAKYTQALDYRKLIEAQLGWLTVECATPGAEVSLDGKPLMTGVGTQKRLLRLGHHEVVTSKPGFVTDKRKVLVLPRKTKRIRVKLVTLASQVRIKRRMARWIPWLTFSVGVAALAVGIPLGVKGRGDLADYDERVAEHCAGLPGGGCTSEQLPQSLKDLHARGRTLQNASYAIIAVGGAVTATGILLLILNRGRKVEASSPAAGARSMTLVPAIVPGGATLTWSGSF